MGKICAFFGHREPFNLGNEAELSQRLTEVITTLIEKEGVDTFYIGGHGAFDDMAGLITHKLKKEKYPFIETWLILAYPAQLHQSKPLPYYDVFDYPLQIERCKKHVAIPARNQYMVRRADFIVSYLDTYGGAYEAVKFALKKKKTVINLASFDLSLYDD